MQDHIKGHLSTNGGNYSTVRSSVYGQVDYRFNLKTKLTAGFQVNKPDRQDAQTSPRLALVHTFNPHWSAKALYAEAFRSPFGSELYFDAGFLQGDVNLKPETIKTAEFQLNYSKPEFTISSTLYHSISNHLIGRSNINGVPTFVNSDQEITYIGTEIEARWAITSKLQLQGNASYQENQDGDGNNDVMAASNTMVKIGLNYTSDYGVSAGIWNNYLGDVAKIEEMPNNSVQVLNPEAKAVNLLSINVLANMEKVLKKSSWSNVEASIYADNILNEKVWFPEMSYQSVNTFPQSHARGVYLKVSVTY
ncbi:TonB-dependent receptor plug domain-containing protein [Algibacillus agarilyticus]|uniref:TonB-dependent receptor plug domain-containing protein n=1 Tax=Algibacillus agarilyticus TaxID=2234133 RepID=UPI001300BE86|nr:TonB-dependent receptor [Algibacillus agarilyticus]